MKKKIILPILLIISSIVTIGAAPLKFSFNLSFNKSKNIENRFNREYELTYQKEDNMDTEITLLSKKVTYLLLGNMNELDDDIESYYQRHKEYDELSAYKYLDKSSSLYSHKETINYALSNVFNKFNELDIVYNSFKSIRVSKSNELTLSIVTLPNVTMKKENKLDPTKYDNIKTNLILYYYFMSTSDGYKLFNVFGEETDNLSVYFNELEDDESSMMKISSYKSGATSIYDYSKLDSVKDDELNNIYNLNKNNIVYLRSFYNNEVKTVANGFYINEGLVVTTWSMLEKSLSDAQYITVTTNDGIENMVDGIVTMNPENDIAVLKLHNKTVSHVNITNGQKLSIEDPVFTLSSKTGAGISLLKGIVISNDNYLETSIPLIKADEGSPIFDLYGNLVGMNTSKSIDASISLGTNLEPLKELQNKFSLINFEDVDYITFDKLKEEFYYKKVSKEKVSNSIPKNKWDECSKVGSIEDNIKLELVKGTYKDGIVSLRYKNNISNYVSSLQMASSYIDTLKSDGYEEVLKDIDRLIYENERYQVIIMDEFDYLIIVMVKK